MRRSLVSPGCRRAETDVRVREKRHTGTDRGGAQSRTYANVCVHTC